MKQFRLPMVLRTVLNIIWNKERLLLLLLCLSAVISSCGVCKHQPTHTETNIRDSVVVHIKDSTAVQYVPVEVQVPVEVLREIVPAQDSSHLETSIAESTAYIDTLGFLHHSLENKRASLHTTAPVEEHFSLEKD